MVFTDNRSVLFKSFAYLFTRSYLQMGLLTSDRTTCVGKIPTRTPPNNVTRAILTGQSSRQFLLGQFPSKQFPPWQFPVTLSPQTTSPTTKVGIVLVGISRKRYIWEPCKANTELPSLIWTRIGLPLHRLSLVWFWRPYGGKRFTGGGGHF